MKLAVLRGNGLTKNTIFDRSSVANRDDCFAPYIRLRELLLDAGIQIVTADQDLAAAAVFEIHQDVQAGGMAPLNYLLMLETELVKFENGDPAQWRPYRKIFTWNDTLVDGKRFIKINSPNPLQVNVVDGFARRDRFCCLISGNKALPKPDPRNLYPERVKAIRWFEANAPRDFDLYGIGWDAPAVQGGILGNFMRRCWKAVGKVVTLRPFPSYRGKVANKREVLVTTRFAICYENVRDMPGYITEKIFDCFFAGCVPVYWGANNITEYVPAGCFVDRRAFTDIAAVYAFLKDMTEQEFIGYQERIAAFLRSDAAYQFGSEAFAQTIVSTIALDDGA